MKKWLVAIPLFLILLLGVSAVVYLNAAHDPGPDPAPVVIEAPPEEPPPAAPAPEPMAVGSPDLKAIEAQKQDLEIKLAEARRELTDLRRQAVVEPAAAPATTNPAPDKPGSFMESFASMMDSPDMREAIKAQSRMALDQSHGEFFRGMELPTEVQGQLKDLLVERNMSAMSTGFKAMRGEAEDGENGLAAMEAVNEQIRELLGDEDYELFERFEETQTERMQVDLFKERLSGDLELDWETQDRLIEAMANARLAAPQHGGFESMNAGGSMPTPEMMSGVLDYMDGINDLYLEEAAAILNAEQFSVFEESLEQYATMQRAGMKMAEAMFGNQDEGIEEE